MRQYTKILLTILNWYQNRFSVYLQNQFFLFGFGLVCVIYVISPSLNPFDSRMFTFHDITQAGRVTSFVNNLQNLQIPPRLAPEYSFRLSFPAFNYYAPSAYWITSALAITGLPVIVAVKVSFLLSLLIAFVGMHYLLSQLFKDYMAAAVGAVTYLTATYFASEVVVRGNLAECWWLALLPLSLGLLIQNSRRKNIAFSVPVIIALALLFTSHNMLSLFSILIAGVFICFLPNRKKNFLTFFGALLLDSYFFIPAFLESHWVHAGSVAKEYRYTEHFLCSWQLWSARGWQFGGSLPGCEADTMSFKLGKLQLILAGLGITAALYQLLFRKNTSRLILTTLYFTVIFLGSLFLTLEYSKFIWEIFEPIMSLFQFPWRFVALAMVCMGILSGYFFYTIKCTGKEVLTMLIIVVLSLSARKYFIKPLLDLDQYQISYNSSAYLEKSLAYKMKEYLPQTVDYIYWSTLNKSLDEEVPLGFDYKQPIEFPGKYTATVSDFRKEVIVSEPGKGYVNIHYTPLWNIAINSQPFTPIDFDKLGRPVVELNTGDTVEIIYRQTLIEKIANAISGIAILILFSISLPQLRDILTKYKFVSVGSVLQDPFPN
jgi:hypothetical protein